MKTKMHTLRKSAAGVCRQVLLAVAMLLTGQTLSAQGTDDRQDKLFDLQENFARFSQENPRERVYLHFDNTSYYKGEHIWFKAYLVEEETLQPSPLSRILYVELVNPIGYPVETLKLLVRNGQTSGSFLLKDTLNAGFYEVRAYTAWMLNFAHGNGHGWEHLKGITTKEFYGERFQTYLKGNAGIFSRVFPVYEKVEDGRYDKKLIPRLPKATASLKDDEKDRLLMDFYPEGGNLVRGVPTRVAFQAHTSEGRSLNVEGRLVRGGKEIGTFQTAYAGRGLFSVTCDSIDEHEDELTRGLKLRVNYGGKDYTFSLPKSHRRGYVLNVFQNDETIRATVARNSLTPGKQLGVSVTSRGVTLYSEVVDLRESLSSQIIIDKPSLQTGVNIVTLYDEGGKVVAQREVFVNLHDMDGYRLQAAVADSVAEMEACKKQTMQWQLVDKDGQPVKGRHKVSLAITDAQFREQGYNDDNALTYLLLSSEVKGFIPHAAYYFEADDHEHRVALDLLMMVQGWTRYDFETMMSGKRWEPLEAVERGLNFRGRVVDEYDNGTFWKPLKKPMWVFTELHSQEGEFSHAEIKTDSLGFFMFNLNPFFGTASMALMLNKQSAEEIGEYDAGIPGHNFSIFKYKRPAHLVGKHLIPMNAFSPVARDYDYYETLALGEPVDRNIFRDGFMATLRNQSAIAYYDRRENAYVLRDVEKHKNRAWLNFKDVKPVAVIDVRDMMTYLSNIFGSVNDFHFFFESGTLNDRFTLMGNDQQKGAWWQPGMERDGSLQNNFADDSFFATMELLHKKESDLTDRERRKLAEARESGLAARSMRIYNRLHSHKDYKFDYTFGSYYNFYKLLMLLGLDGMNRTAVDVEDGVEPIFRAPHYYGIKEQLPPGMRFFPPDVNFSKLYLYADVDDRSMIHREGRYLERLEHFSREKATSHTTPLTSIINFKTTELLTPGIPQPDFYGYRINFQGLSEPDEFYQVDYSKQALPEQGDYRRTLYWNPSVRTDEDGRLEVTFYNNSFSKSVSVSAEGFSNDGNLIIAAP